MARYECSVCGHTYDEDTDGKAWVDLPDDWTCPECGAARSFFEPVGGDEGLDEGLTVSVPGALVRGHRVCGYVFLAVYLYFLWQMVPRLWSYQIEFPARTVVHLTLGMAIGAVLLVKILIVRFFRRFDAALVPMLGTSLFVGSVVLVGLSAPFAFHEAVLRRASAAQGLFAADNLERIRALLAETELDETECERLATPEALRAGQNVLRRTCTECHDLRTVLARPRTPENWRQTVRRMADRTTSLDPLEEAEQRLVTAYLIAISPQLQRSAREIRAEEEFDSQTEQAIQSVAGEETPSTDSDFDRAKLVFQTQCGLCHTAKLVEAAPPGSADEARFLVARMVEEGSTATQEELEQVVQYLIAAYTLIEDAP